MENKTANGMYVLRGELKKGLIAELVKAYDQLTQESEKLKILGLRYNTPRRIVYGFMYEVAALTVKEIMFKTEGGFYILQDDFESSDDIDSLAKEIIDVIDCNGAFLERLLKE
ncbi:TPA: hypothetical protein ACQI7E_001635 [Escherichia coli]